MCSKFDLSEVVNLGVLDVHGFQIKRSKKVESDSVKFMFVQVNVFIDAFLIFKIVKSGFCNSRILWAEKITCSQAAFHFIIIWPQYFSLLLKSYFHFHPKMSNFQSKNDIFMHFYHMVNGFGASICLLRNSGKYVF